MTAPARKKAVFDDLYTIPENMIGEIIDGELIASPRPSMKHARAASSLGYAIGPSYDTGERGGPGGWIIIHEPEIVFGENIFVPDLAGWKRNRLPEAEEPNWIETIPDWVCEIISPSSAGTDRVKKMTIYGSHQVPYYWLIDPMSRTLEAYKLESGRWVVLGTYAERDKAKVEPFQEIEIDLSLLWLENIWQAKFHYQTR